MQPIIDNLRAELQSAESVLRQPSEADATLRALLEDRFYCEKQQKAILDWLPRVSEQLGQIAAAHEIALAEKDKRIAELEAQAAQPVDMPQAPVLHVVGE